MSQKKKNQTEVHASSDVPSGIDFKQIPIWAVGAFFVITTLVFFSSQIFGSSFFWEDFVRYVYPMQNFAAREGSLFNVPFWNPFAFRGMPFFADLQTGFFYPFNRLLSFFVDGDGHLSVRALEMVIIFHFLVAQFSMFLLARRWKISSSGAMISAVSYSFSAIFVCHAIHPMMIYHLAWLPLIAVFLLNAVEKASIRSGAIGGLIFGMSALAGHPPTLLYESVLLGGLMLWLVIGKARDKQATDKKLAVSIFSSIILFLIMAGIFAVQLLPSQELAGQSQRDEITFDKATEGSLQLKQLYTAASPQLFGSVDGKAKSPQTFYLKFRDKFASYNYWETSFYFGVVALMLGLLGAIVRFKTLEGSFLICTALLGVLIALGDNGFLYGILYNMPLFGSFRNPARLMFYAVFAMSLLAGFGFDALASSRNNKPLLMKLFMISGVTLLVSLVTLTGTLPNMFGAPVQVIEPIIMSGRIIAVIVLLATMLFIMVNKGTLKPELGGSILAVLAFVDLFLALSSFNQGSMNPADALKMDANLKRTLQANPTQENYRVSMRIYEPIRYSAMDDNQGIFDRLQLVEGYNPLMLQRIATPFTTRQNALNLSNVKYYIDVDTVANKPVFLENLTCFKRARLLHADTVVAESDVPAVMTSGTFDFANRVVLEQDPGIALSQENADSSLTALKCTSYENNYFSYDVNAATPSLLVLSEMWYPAWQAYLDCKPVNILRANFSFRALAIPAGDHKVEMRYESKAFSTGLMISIFTLAFALALMVNYKKLFKKELI
jgi:hypothetical protein